VNCFPGSPGFLVKEIDFARMTKERQKRGKVAHMSYPPAPHSVELARPLPDPDFISGGAGRAFSGQ